MTATTTTMFDPIKALHEEIEGVSNIVKTLTAETRKAERAAAEAAQYYDSMVKLKAFAEQELLRKRRVLSQLQEDKERQ
jgi:hypothetical protein